MQIADAFPWLLSQLVADGANIVLRATGEGSMYEVASASDGASVQ
jgi:hypothetical protein